MNTAEHELFSWKQDGIHEELVRREKSKKKEKRKSLDVLALLGPLTTRPSIASLSDVINIDIVIKQLSGNEGGRGGPMRDIRPARHVSRMHVQRTLHP